MRIKLICGAVTRTFTMVALGSFFVSVNLAIAGPSVQEQLKGSCYAHQTSNGHVSTYRDSVDFSTKYYSTSRFDSKKAKWNSVLKIQQELKAKNCQGQIRNYATKFFRAALKANEKSCSNKDSRCAEYNNWAQNLYESALKNDDTIILEMLNKHSSYISKKQTQKLINIKKEICTNVLFGCIPSAEERAEKKKAAEDAKKKAAEEAAKKKAAEEAAKKKAAEDAKKKWLADIRAKMKKAAEDAKKKAAEEKAVAKNTKVVDLYILTSKSLMEMYEKGNKQLYKLQGNINAVEIKQPIGKTQIKTITLDGQSKTISCGDTCTLYSAKKNSLQVGSDLGIPAYIHKAIMDAIVEAMGEEFVKNLSETELRKFQVAMRKLIVPHWKSLEDVVAKVMGDPNFNIASFMTKEQIEQIKIIQMQIRKSSQKNKGSGQESSGGSAASAPAEAHHEEAHHEEAY